MWFSGEHGGGSRLTAGLGDPFFQRFFPTLMIPWFYANLTAGQDFYTLDNVGPVKHMGCREDKPACLACILPPITA